MTTGRAVIGSWWGGRRLPLSAALAVALLMAALGLTAGAAPAVAAQPLTWTSCPGVAWYPFAHRDAFGTFGGERRGDPSTYVCPLQLPDGATIAQVRFYVRDTSPTLNVDQCRLLRTHIEPADGATSSVTNQVRSGAVVGLVRLDAVPVRGALVDNRRWAYAVGCRIASAADQGIIGATVGYRLPARLGATRWASCGPWGFFPSNDALDWHIDQGVRYASDIDDPAGFGYLHCGLALPHGAKLTALHAALVDTTATYDVVCGAYRSSLAANTSVTALSDGRIATSGSPGALLDDDGPPDNPTVNDQGFAYWVECTGGKSGSDLGIAGTQGIAMGFTPSAAQTRWVSCHGLAFRPETSGVAYNDFGRASGSARYLPTVGARLACRLDLPDGWTMRKVRFVAWDDDPAADESVHDCQVRRVTLAGGKVGDVSSPLSSVGFSQVALLDDATLSRATIDQSRYAYWAECQVAASPTQDVGLFGVTVKVTR
ncbi:MAG: hypothetical protein U0869_24560 [Chloroflexota bacterium]